jgi:histidine triad (HIT) family protein
MKCIFCEIVEGRSPASVIFRDDAVVAFMALRPTAPGECLVIPKQHVDHFTDLDDAMAQRIMLVAQRIGRRLRAEFKPLRVGMLVHGFGVSHAHLILVPQMGPHHLTSDQFASIRDGRVVFSEGNTPVAERAVLDDHARRLAIV